jgi:hypothetical protein
MEDDAMSGKPSPEGVKKLRELAATCANMANEAASLVDSLSIQKSRLVVVNDEYAIARTTLLKHLDEMDCSGTGNFGWEGRIVWMFQEIERQVSRERLPA